MTETNSATTTTIPKEEFDDDSLDEIFNVAREAVLLAGSRIRKAWFSKDNVNNNDGVAADGNNGNDNADNTTSQLKTTKAITRKTTTDDEIKNTKSSSADLVTETDHQCEGIILNLLRSKYPTHEFIGEESTSSSDDSDNIGNGKYESSNNPTWVVDPIDGTTNFVHRLALSCVIVAFTVQKEVKVGVVYDPISDEMFWAIKNRGAFLQRFASSCYDHHGDRKCVLGDDDDDDDGISAAASTATTTTTRRRNLPIPISVSSTKSIPKALIAMDPGYSRDAVDIDAYLSVQRELLLQKVRNIRIIGSTGLNMAYVSCGRLDACFEEGSWETDRGPKIWDIAAGMLLISEAGGVTCDLDQKIVPTNVPLDLLGRSNFCAATNDLAEEIMKCIQCGRLSQNNE